MPSASFQRFVEQLDRAPTSIQEWETYDLDLLRGLDEAERGEVERRLIARLETVEDGRVPPALAALGGPKAVAALQAARTRYRGMAEVRVLKALWDLTHADDVATSIAGLIQSPDPTVRAFATAVASDVDHPATSDRTIDRLLSDDLALRSEALSALMNRFGLDPYWEEKRQPFGLWVMGLYTPLMAVWRPACAQLVQLFARLARGETPESLGLERGTWPESDAFLRFRTSLFAHPSIGGPWQKTLDIDAGRQLAGADVPWSKQILAHALAEGDPRAASAIRDLGYVELLPALREQAMRQTPVPEPLLDAIGVLGHARPPAG